MTRYAPYFIVIVMIIGLLLQCEKASKQKTQFDANMIALSDSVAYYKNRIGTKNATITAIQGDKRTIEKLLLDKDAELKALTKEFVTLNQIIKFNSTANIDTIFIPFNEPVIIADSSKTLNLDGNAATEWYRLKYRITNDSLTISSFSMPAQTTIITGFKRKWLLGKQTLVTDVTTNNPYISITGIKSAEVIIPEPWYKKWYIWLGAGIAGGVLIK